MVRLLALLLIITGCSYDHRPPQRVLRLAVTTSTRDSGLLDELLPEFERHHKVRVDVVAVGTGAALRLGQRGDVDVVLVHARTAEDAFMEAGYGCRREDLMQNRFEILGPAGDPAAVENLESDAALQRIADTGQPFVSRGDNSGTHKRELALWEAGGGQPTWAGYFESGQGMGPTLVIADEKQAYVLSDRGTYLRYANRISLAPLVSSDKGLLNPYGIIVVTPQSKGRGSNELAHALVDYMISTEAQHKIRDFAVDGEPMFQPLRLGDPS